MHGHIPLRFDDMGEAAERLANVFWSQPLQVRNEFANGFLAWAELQGTEVFARCKRAVLDTEYALCAKEWRAKDPSMDSELAIAKLMALTVAMVQGTSDPGADGKTYIGYLGPDIPQIIRKLFERLYEAHQ